MDLISLVSEEIAYYLKHKRKAAIPGFGRFHAIAQSASFDPDTNVLIAPFDIITFTPDLEERDCGFTDYLASHHKQAGLLELFLSKVIESLSEKGRVHLPELGECSKSEDGLLHFTSEVLDANNTGFDLKGILLNPIQSMQQETIVASPNPPGASKHVEPIKKNRRGMLGLALITMGSFFVVTLLISTRYQNTEDPVFQKVSTRYNVSPKDNQNEVLVTSINSDLSTSLASISIKGEMVNKQLRMSEVNTDVVNNDSKNIARIVTNTFGSEANVVKQLKLISSLGFAGERLVKTENLVSTIIIVEYTDQHNLETVLSNIKEQFPRAKLLP